MSQPKKKTSRSRRDIRRYHSTHMPSVMQGTVCAKCNDLTRPHRVCASCGYYPENKKSGAKSASS